MAKASYGPTLQPYPREKNVLLAQRSLFPPLEPPMDYTIIESSVDESFKRCIMKKSGRKRSLPTTPEELVELCIKHLRTRSDPILSPYFVSQCGPDSLFELDAVSHEMQRHRMTIGVFYQYLLLELMRNRWHVFDGYREGDIVADIDTPGFKTGLRLYMSVKKSQDTVGGQDVGGVISRLESLAKQEKNLTRPYLCVICIATPSSGLLKDYNDRHIRCTNEGNPYSLNCEFWGPGFIFPYVTGRNAKEIYLHGVKRVADHLPFFTLEHRQKCSSLLKKRLEELDLLDAQGKISSEKFLEFSCAEKIK